MKESGRGLITRTIKLRHFMMALKKGTENITYDRKDSGRQS